MEYTPWNEHNDNKDKTRNPFSAEMMTQIELEKLIPAGTHKGGSERVETKMKKANNIRYVRREEAARRQLQTGFREMIVVE